MVVEGAGLDVARYHNIKWRIGRARLILHTQVVATELDGFRVSLLRLFPVLFVECGLFDLDRLSFVSRRHKRLCPSVNLL